MPLAQDRIRQYVKLEQRLVLLAWLNSLLGYRSNRDLLADTRGTEEGFDAEGRSFLHHHLLARGGKVKVPRHDLARYDDNICAHLAAMNRGRPEPITLRYFQYLAALYAEIFLDRYFSGRRQMVADLNAFVQQRNDANLTEADLHGATILQTSLDGANLCLANLADAHLWNVQLDNARLAHANLTGADLKGARLTGAGSSHADLSGAKVTAQQLAQAARLAGAIMPDVTKHS